MADSPGGPDRREVSSFRVTLRKAGDALPESFADHATRTLRSLRLMSLAAWRGVGELYNSDGLTHAASIAYYALLSLFPFLLLVLSVLGMVTADEADRDAVVRFVFRYFPAPVRLHDRAARRVSRADGSPRRRRPARADLGVARRLQRRVVGDRPRLGRRAAPQLPDAPAGVVPDDGVGGRDLHHRARAGEPCAGRGDQLVLGRRAAVVVADVVEPGHAPPTARPCSSSSASGCCSTSFRTRRCASVTSGRARS